MQSLPLNNADYIPPIIPFGIAPLTIPIFLGIAFFFGIACGGIPAGIGIIGFCMGVGVLFWASAWNWLIAFADGFLAIWLPSLRLLH